jgi:hypothetical protein
MKELSSHMKKIVRPNGYWNNYEKCLEASLTCEGSIKLFIKNFPTAYIFSRKNDWVNKFFKNKKKKLVCAYDEKNNLIIGPKTIPEIYFELGFGEKVKSGIYKCLSGKRKTYKGYTFKYVD